MSITNQPRPTKQSASSPTGAARWNHGRARASAAEARASAAGAGASTDGRRFSPPRWQPTVVTRLLRRRSVYWTLAVGLILLTIGVTYSQNRRASSIISSFGEQRDVLVAARDLGRGEAISREDFRIEQRPEGFVPLGALRWEGEAGGAGGLEGAGSPSGGAGSAMPMAGGLEGVGLSVGGAGSEGPAVSGEWNEQIAWGAEWSAESWGDDQVALEPIYAGEILVSGRVGSGEDLRIPPGTSAIAVPTSENRLSLNRSDRVDLLGSFPDGPTGEVSVLLVAQNAFVVETADRSITVAVQSAELPGVVRGLTHGVVTIVLRG